MRKFSMIYRWYYKTPEQFSDMWMESDGTDVLTGLWFEGSHDMKKHRTEAEEKLLPVFEETAKWLDLYYAGREPDFTPPYRIDNLTPFREDVVKAMLSIPRGQFVTYGDIAAAIAKERGIKKMSSRAVGGAVGWNPLCILIPCHRVVGAGGSLTGYGGGIRNKVALLSLEGVDMSRLYVPDKGTKL